MTGEWVMYNAMKQRVRRSVLATVAGAVLSISTVLNLSASCVSPSSGLVGWWPAEGSASDVVGGNNGTLTNGVTFAPGKVGQAFNFDGISGAITVPASPSLAV